MALLVLAPGLSGQGVALPQFRSDYARLGLPASPGLAPDFSAPQFHANPGAIGLTSLASPPSVQSVTAPIVKVRGTVTQETEGGGSIRLYTGSIVPLQRKVSVARFGVAVYKLAGSCVIKQNPQAALTFTRLARSDYPQGHSYGVDVSLQKGDIYNAVRQHGFDADDFHVMTTRMEAITHGAVFKVSHANSTSVIAVREGIVEVRWCKGSKHAYVHSGEVMVITDCEGVLRWLNDDELREMSLFAAIIDSAFDTHEVDPKGYGGGGSGYPNNNNGGDPNDPGDPNSAANGGPGGGDPDIGMPGQHVAVLAPEIPPDLPLISP